MVEAILVILFPLVAHMVAHSSCLLPVAHSLGLVIGCLHAWDNQGNAVVGFTFEVSPILDEV